MSVDLTRQERRALREIEQALAAEDPTLAELLSGPASLRHARVLRRMTAVAVAVSLTLLILGLLLPAVGLQTGGLLMLLLLPTTLWCVAQSLARGP
jgi:hypothetical protein